MGSLFRGILGMFAAGGQSDSPSDPADVVAHVPGLT